MRSRKASGWRSQLSPKWNSNYCLAGICLLFFSVAALGESQTSVEYRLRYDHPGEASVAVSLSFPHPIPGPAFFVMPRNYPGGYSLVFYDSFVKQLSAFSSSGKQLAATREPEGPRWKIGTGGDSISRIEYRTDIVAMERELLSAVDSSRVRRRYAGILGYSVFGYVDGLKDRAATLRVDAPAGWPVISTLHPAVPAPVGETSSSAENYYGLADSQILMGPDLQLRSLPGKIPLVMAVYAEGAVDVDLEAQLAREALDRVEAYFGESPFTQYTVQLELLRPLAGHDYGFSQEHVESGTFSLSVGAAATADSPAVKRERTRFNYAHHMAHCWIPKRVYGVGYLPFNWELPPVIDTIWFNEGFARYATIDALAEAMPADEAAEFRGRQLARLRTIVDDAPSFIREMPLLVLSREASFIYSRDFRIGSNIFARGALMAAEIDRRIRERTGGKKTLRDALRYLLQWSAEQRRPFTVEEFPDLLARGSGVDVREVIERWMKPAAVQ